MATPVELRRTSNGRPGCPVTAAQSFVDPVALDPDDGGATYFVEPPDSLDTSGSYTFGPVEYARADDGAPDVDTNAGDDAGDVDPWFAVGGGSSTTNRLWRKDNAAVESVGVDI